MTWIDWALIVIVGLLAEFVIRHRWRMRREVEEAGPPASALNRMISSAGDATGTQRPPDVPWAVEVKRISSTEVGAFSRFRDKFEQMTVGSGDDAASVWQPLAAIAFAGRAEVPYGLEHFQEVSRLAAQIAAQMRLSAAEIEEIRVAGVVHDIGKTHVPESVRLTPQQLTAEEFEVMKAHAALGARILEPLREEGLGRIVRHHHERFDGQGYPDHLKGEDIPLGARIMAVAESFDAMVSDHAYKSARTFDDAIAEVRRCSGTQFDPNVVSAFLNRVEAHGDHRYRI